MVTGMTQALSMSCMTFHNTNPCLESKISQEFSLIYLFSIKFHVWNVRIHFFLI